jgi:hypothetical protein
LTVAGTAALSACAPADPAHSTASATHTPTSRYDSTHGATDALLMPGFDGEVDHAANGFNPTDILTDFDYGKTSQLPNGQTLREYTVFAAIKTVEVMPGIPYEAWTYNGRIPGPTFRCTEGDRIRIHFTNATPHKHTIHFHGIHPGNMDGVYEQVPPGGQFVYEFDAEPFGLHLYHCHVFPLAEHIARGLYGAFIIDPKPGRARAEREMVMVMTGTDLDFDGENDVYAVNFIPFHYDKHPIQVRVGELVRVYLVNLLELTRIICTPTFSIISLPAPVLRRQNSRTQFRRCKHSAASSNFVSNFPASICSTRIKPSLRNWVGPACSRWRHNDGTIDFCARRSLNLGAVSRADSFTRRRDCLVSCNQW